MIVKLLAPLAIAAALAAAPLLPAGAGLAGSGVSGNPDVAAGEVSCRLPNGQTVRLTPHDCAARGGTVVGG
jgi:hypothetical protein